MGNGPSLADNEEEETTSGVSRLCGSIICAVCVAPMLILAMVAMVGYNEQHAVCQAKALSAGKDAVKQSGCGKAENSGSLVMFQCPLAQVSERQLADLSDPGGFTGKFKGVGLKVAAEMYQCVEHTSTETKKSKAGGGKTTTKTTYTYSKEWRSSYVDSGSFKMKESSSFRSACGKHNPKWSSVGLPTSDTKYDKAIKAGAYTIDDDSGVSKSAIPLNKLVAGISAPSGWKKGLGSYSFYLGSTSGTNIGDARVSFKSNDWSNSEITVVGKNVNGKITPWKAPAAWLCSGNPVSALSPGKVEKEKMFKNLNDALTTSTWLFRLLGFAVLWFAFTLCFGPLEVAADCIPCIGPWIGDFISAVTCCIACCPATVCFLGVAGAVWVAMRPMIGIPLMLLWVACMCGAVYYFMNRQPRKGDPLMDDSAPTYGVAEPPAQDDIPDG